MCYLEPAISMDAIDSVESLLKMFRDIAIGLKDETFLQKSIPFLVDLIFLLLRKANEIHEIRPAAASCIANLLQGHIGILEGLALRNNDEVTHNRLFKVFQWDSTSTISPSYCIAMLQLRAYNLVIRHLSRSQNLLDELQNWICLLHEAGHEKNVSFYCLDI